LVHLLAGFTIKYEQQIFHLIVVIFNT